MKRLTHVEAEAVIDAANTWIVDTLDKELSDAIDANAINDWAAEYGVDGKDLLDVIRMAIDAMRIAPLKGDTK